MQPRSTPATVAPAFTQRLLEGSVEPAVGRDIARFGWGLGLAAAYGLALGLRTGGRDLWHHALGVPLAFVAVGLIGVPALLILMTLFDAPLSPHQAARAVSTATARAGLLLAGLAPAVALYVTSSEDRWMAAAVGGIGLVVGGAVGLSAFLHEVGRDLSEEEESKRWFLGFCFGGFALFAILLSARVWWAALPLIGGAS